MFYIPCKIIWLLSPLGFFICDVMIAGDLKGAVQTLRSLLLFHPNDADSLSNLQLYSESIEGDAEFQAIAPSQVHNICKASKYSKYFQN